MASWSVGGSAASRNIFEDAQGLHIGVQSPSSGTWVNYYAGSQFVNAQVFHATMTIPYTSAADGVFNPGFYVEGSDYAAIVGCQPYADSTGYYWTLANTNDAGNTWTTLYISSPSSLPQTQDCTVVTNGSNVLKVYLGGTVIFSSTSMALGMPYPIRVFFQVDTSSSMMRLATFANYYATASEKVTVTNGPPGGTAQIVDSTNRVLASSPVAANGTAVMLVGAYALPLTAYVKALDGTGGLFASTPGPLQIYGGDVYAVSGAPSTSPTATAVTPNPASTNAGSAVTLTATVTDTGSSPSSPSGAISWSDVGKGGSFNPTSCTLSTASPSTSSCQTSYTPLPSGPVTITANYPGDASHAPSSGTSSVAVSARSVSVAVTPNPSAVTASSQITFTSVVTDTSAGTPTTPTGTLTWGDGGAGGSFSGSTCALSSGQCSVVYTAPSASGSVTIRASYSGDSTHASGSGTSSLTVNAPSLHSTTTVVSPNPASVGAGNQIAFTATVTDISNSPSSLSGSVTWSDGGAGGTFVSGTCALSPASASSGSCSATYSSPRSAATVTITASYLGDSAHATSSGTSSLAVKKFSLVKEANGLVARDPLNNVTMSQQQLQASSRYWRYGGDAVGLNAPYQFNEDPQGFHIGVQATASGKYAGFYAVTPPSNAQVYHARITEPVQTIPSDVFNAALYVQTGNGSVDYVFCGPQTTASGTTWSVWQATGNSTMAKSFTQLWFDPTPNQPLTRSCTLVTNGANYLAVYIDNSLVYQSSALKLSMPSPFIAFLEVQSSYAGQMLSGTFTDFYATMGPAVTVDNLPAGAATVQLVDSFGNVITSSPVSNGIAVLDIGRYPFPLPASIVVNDSTGGTLASSGPLTLWGGDRYGVVAG